MGLFSTLASATGGSNNSEAVVQTTASTTTTTTTTTTTPASSATIPTVVQLYSNQQIILMEDTPNVTGYTSLTYQAVQVGAAAAAAGYSSSRDHDTIVELKNRHSNPDLGVWNCRVVVGGQNNNNNKDENSDPLIDSLLARVASSQTSSSSSSSSVYCLTVDLSDETTVEPNLSALQAALVRHLIEHPPSQPIQNTTDGNGNDNDDDDDDDVMMTNTIKMNTKTKMTSLYDLQTAQFGLATSEEEKSAKRSIEESAKDVKVGLMICAVVSSSNGNDNNNNNNNVDESSESAYKKKQARALVVYHLRKFANSIHAALCFVERPKSQQQQESTLNESSAESATGNTATTGNGNGNGNTTEDSNAQLAISYDRLSQLWRDMATGVPVWEQQQQQSPPPSTETAAEGAGSDTVTATALYGPGRQQEDLIESLLLRNANYPGHWDASKDSLWVALPASGGTSSSTETETKTSSTATATATTGDDGWLTQLRDSIASALPTADKTDNAGANNNTEKGSADGDKSGKPKEKDAAVSSFFESLLKNP